MTPRRSVTPLLVAVLGVGMLAGLFARSAIDAAFGAPALPPTVVAAPVLAQPTIAVQIRAVLEMPTATPTTVPTRAPTRAPTTTVTINWCGAPEPGRTCQVPPPPTPTPEPMRDCYVETRPGAWCYWPETETTAREETH